MEDNDRQRDPASEQPAAKDGADAGERSRSASTVQELARVTRQMSVADRRPPVQVATSAMRERVATLIAALGDSAHPLHQRAVDDLIAIGPSSVPQLCDALHPQNPWLAAYRAADALGRIGDGRAAGPLLETLRHPNSNVRWSAVRALASVGDARALLELRRVARSDQGRTSWGESVGGAAQSVLDQMQSRNVLLRGADLIKTAVACVFMLVSLILAWSFVTALRDELRNIGRIEGRPVALAPIIRTALPTIPVPTSAPRPTLEPLATSEIQPTTLPAIPVDGITAIVVASGNVRGQPTRAANNVIGSVTEGDQVLVLASTPDRQWYRIALGEQRAASSRIDSADSSGWVARSLLTPIEGDVPVEEPPPAPTLPPQPVEPPTTEPAPPTLTPVP